LEAPPANREVNLATNSDVASSHFLQRATREQDVHLQFAVTTPRGAAAAAFYRVLMQKCSQDTAEISAELRKLEKEFEKRKSMLPADASGLLLRSLQVGYDRRRGVLEEELVRKTLLRALLQGAIEETTDTEVKMRGIVLAAEDMLRRKGLSANALELAQQTVSLVSTIKETKVELPADKLEPYMDIRYIRGLHVMRRQKSGEFLKGEVVIPNERYLRREAKKRYRAKLHRTEAKVLLAMQRRKMEEEDKELDELMAEVRKDTEEARRRSSLTAYDYPAGSWECKLCHFWNFPTEERCGGMGRRSIRGGGMEKVRCSGIKALHLGCFVRCPVESAVDRITPTFDLSSEVIPAPPHGSTYVRFHDEEGQKHIMTMGHCAKRELVASPRRRVAGCASMATAKGGCSPMRPSATGARSPGAPPRKRKDGGTSGAGPEDGMLRSGVGAGRLWVIRPKRLVRIAQRPEQLLPQTHQTTSSTASSSSSSRAGNGTGPARECRSKRRA